MMRRLIYVWRWLLNGCDGRCFVCRKRLGPDGLCEVVRRERKRGRAS